MNKVETQRLWLKEAHMRKWKRLRTGKYYGHVVTHYDCSDITITTFRRLIAFFGEGKQFVKYQEIPVRVADAEARINETSSISFARWAEFGSFNRQEIERHESAIALVFGHDYEEHRRRQIESAQILKQFNVAYLAGEEELLLLRKLKLNGFSQDQIVKIVDVLIGVCPHCYNGERSCACSRS